MIWSLSWSIDSFPHCIFGPIKLISKFSIFPLEYFDFDECWLHKLFHRCIILAGAFCHVIYEWFKVLFCFSLVDLSFLINDIILDVSECVVELFYFVSFCFGYFGQIPNLLLEFLLLHLELLLLNLPLFIQLFHPQPEFLTIQSIFGGNFLILGWWFANHKFIILLLQIFDLFIFAGNNLLILFKLTLSFWWVKVLVCSPAHDFIYVSHLFAWS